MYDFPQTSENMPNKVAQKLQLYDRMMVLRKARRETVDEFAKALGTTAASIRAYKLNPKREPRPKTIRKLEELEAMLDKPSTASESVESVPASTKFDEPKNLVHSIEAGPNTMQRLERIQKLAEDNRTTLLNLKTQVEQIFEVLAQLTDERIKRKRA